MASSLKKLNPSAQIIVVDNNNTPLEKILGKEIGRAIQNLEENNGIKFIFNRTFNYIKPKENTLNVGSVGIKSENGNEEIIETDMLLLANGVVPNTVKYLKIY